VGLKATMIPCWIDSGFDSTPDSSPDSGLDTDLFSDPGSSTSSPRSGFRHLGRRKISTWSPLGPDLIPTARMAPGRRSRGGTRR